MNVPGVTVVPLVTATEEAAPPELPLEGADLVLVGGGLVGEYGGWLWLVRGGVVRRLWKAEPTEVEQANAIRGAIERGLAERRSNAS